MIWGNCSKMGENCPFHDFFQKKSTYLRLSKILNLIKGPKETIQELIYNYCGIHVQSCKGEKDDPCPENGMRQRHAGASFSSCPWVITIIGHLDFNAIDDIPKNVIIPPDTQYSLASVILFNGQHFEGISLDAKNSQGIHLIYDGMNEPEKRIQTIKTDDAISTYAYNYKVAELWYVKVDYSSSASGSASLSTTLKPDGIPNLEQASYQPSYSLATPSLKPVGIPNLGHTCYLTILVQITFWVLPLKKRLIEDEVLNRGSKQIQPITSNVLEADSDCLLTALGFLKTLLITMQKSMIEKKANLRNIMKKFVKCLGLSVHENQCINEFWNNLFHHYFEYIEVSQLYRLQIRTFYLEVLDHNKTGTAREKKEALSQNLLSILPVDIQNYV